MKPWQTLLNKAPNKGDKERGPKVQAKSAQTQRGGSKGCKRTNYVREPPLAARSILERERKFESIVSLEEVSFMFCSVACALCKTIHIFFVVYGKYIKLSKEDHQCL
jgi:hypothetical protein